MQDNKDLVMSFALWVGSGFSDRDLYQLLLTHMYEIQWKSLIHPESLSPLELFFSDPKNIVLYMSEPHAKYMLKVSLELEKVKKIFSSKAQHLCRTCLKANACTLQCNECRVVLFCDEKCVEKSRYFHTIECHLWRKNKTSNF